MSSPLLDPGPTLETVRRLVELAGRAPSIGNTQPWTWRTDGSRLELLADHTRRLESLDPQGRQLVISCGAALHHLRVAARALGVEAHVDLVDPDDGPGDDGLVLLAGVELGRGGEERERGAADLHVLRSRHTDRERFTSWPIPAQRLRPLARAAERPGVRVVPVVGPDRKAQLAVLVQEGARALATAGPAAGPPPSCPSVTRPGRSRATTASWCSPVPPTTRPVGCAWARRSATCGSRPPVRGWPSSRCAPPSRRPRPAPGSAGYSPPTRACPTWCCGSPGGRSGTAT